MKRFSPIKVVLIVLLLAFLFNQIFSIFYKPISTETAVFKTYNDGYKITGIVIRNEILVTSKQDGVLHFMIDDGQRVAKDGAIANIYESENASITLTQIDTVKNKIKDIEDILSFNDLQAANLDLINNRVGECLNELVLASSTGDFKSLPFADAQLLSAVNRRQAATGNTADFSAQLTSLNSELQSLEASLKNAKGQIKALQSGYFISKTDGYEGVLKTDNLDGITAKFLNNLNKQELPQNVVGKIVSDYEWYIAAEVTLNESLKYKEGDTLNIYTSVKSAGILPVTVKKINISDNRDNAVIIFACNQMNSELASIRSGPMMVVSKEYSGLMIPKKALRVVDSKKGVYILHGMQAKFRPVKIIYSNDDIIICEKSGDDEMLRLYDQVIVKGKNLYDGKIIG